MNMNWYSVICARDITLEAECYMQETVTLEAQQIQCPDIVVEISDR